MRRTRTFLAAAALAACLTIVPDALGGSGPPLGAMQSFPAADGCFKYAGAPSNFTSCPNVAQGLNGAMNAVVSPDGRTVYVAAPFGNSVGIFRRDPRTGTLTPAGASTPVGGGGALGLALSPDGRQLYVAGENDSAIAVLRRDPSSGALTQLPGAGACVQDAGPGAGPAMCRRRAQGLHGVRWVTVSPDGRNVYAASPSGHSIAAFSRDPHTGALTQLAGAAACIEDSQDNVASSGLPNGTLKSNCRQRAEGLAYPRMVVVSPDGQNAYTADDFGDAVAEFKRDPATGALTQMPGADACIEDGPNAPAYTHCPSQTDSINGAFSVAVSPDGANAYVAADIGSAVTAFSRDPGTGALHRLPDAAACIRNNDAPASTRCDVTGNGLLGAEMATVSPDGHTVYVAAFHGMAVSAFSRDDRSGALTQLPGGAGCVEDLRAAQHTSSRCDARADGLYQPRIVALSPDGRNAYVPSSVGSTLASLSLSTNGAPLRFVAPPHARAHGGGPNLVPEAIFVLAGLALAGAAVLTRKQYRAARRRRLKRYQGTYRR